MFNCLVVYDKNVSTTRLSLWNSQSDKWFVNISIHRRTSYVSTRKI